MKDFIFYNPVKIVFGKNSISKLPSLIPPESKIMLTYGQGSIKRNGVFDSVMQNLSEFEVVEFGGITPNPTYETLIQAVDFAKQNQINFILAVGGGSVIDGTKFIAAAIPFEGELWNILSKHSKIKSAIPFGTVLTIPATGSEMNNGAVISKEKTTEKLVFKSNLVFPKFSIMNPEYTFSLPWDQTANGIVDAFVHVTEQYLTFNVDAELQYHQSEGTLKTLIEYASKVKENPKDYNVRSNIMWCATQALNGLLRCGTIEDWATHLIGHELTALLGIPHARSLAVILPHLLKYKKSEKSEMLKRFAKNVWNINSNIDGTDPEEQAIIKTVDFFESLGVPTSLSFYNPDPSILSIIPQRFKQRGFNLGENQNITPDDITKILELSLKS